MVSRCDHDFGKEELNAFEMQDDSSCKTPDCSNRRQTKPRSGDILVEKCMNKNDPSPVRAAFQEAYDHKKKMSLRRGSNKTNNIKSTKMSCLQHCLQWF
jgi:hypothetical protein